MIKIFVLLFLISPVAGIVVPQAPQDNNLLRRRYRDGERLTYQMKGVNENWHYGIQASGIVARGSDGNFVETFGWDDLVSDDKKVALPAESLSFRQELTLDPGRNPAFPNLSKVDSRLIGPITDLMTFYADLWLAIKSGTLNKPADHFYFKHSQPNSWADGSYVLIGEDSIDFDFTLKEVNRSDNTATVVIRHVPPDKPEIRITADWMRKPVSGTANNWVEVRKTQNGKYLAAVGKETFEVVIKLGLADGRVLSGTLDNSVEMIERECEDVALKVCGDSKVHPIKRQIEISSVR